MNKRCDKFERVARDFYPTPMAAVLPLLPHLAIGTRFIEPCAGDGALFLRLEENGMHCPLAYDIAPQSDDIGTADALVDDLLCGLGGHVDFFITNPPWNRKTLHPLIKRLSDTLPTWLLFDADWMHTKQSAPYMPRLRKVVSVGRVNWIPDSKMTGKDNCAWHLFDKPSDMPTQFFGRLA